MYNVTYLDIETQITLKRIIFLMYSECKQRVNDVNTTEFMLMQNFK